VRDLFLPRAFRLFHEVGSREFVRLVLGRVWSSHVSFALRADLAELPEARRARIVVRMEPQEVASFRGFDDELERVSGGDRVEVAHRRRLCAAAVETLYVAVDDSGVPIYAQWLVRRHQQAALHRVTHGLFRQLGQGEALVEGAYTFVNFRRLGAMVDGMSQLLVRARDAGDERVFTYVAVDNIPSLRGCAEAGFVPDHLQRTHGRFGVRHVYAIPLDALSEKRWAEAVE
jgi:hypothetical protein